MASRNAVKHGLLSKWLVLMPGEDQSDYDALAAGVHESLQPDGELEKVLAERVVANVWRLHRLYRLEGALFHRRQCEYIIANAAHQVDQGGPDNTQGRRVLRELTARRQTASRRDDKRELREAMADVVNAEFYLLTPEVALASGFERDALTFAVLSRYEAGIERGIHRALTQLALVQAARKARPADVARGASVTPAQSAPKEN